MAADPSPVVTTRQIRISAEGREVDGLLRSGALPFHPRGQTIPFQSVLAPERNMVWSGIGSDNQFLLLDDRLLGVHLFASVAKLQVISSERTTRRDGQSDFEIIEAEAKRVTQTPSLVLEQAQFEINLESMLGSPVFRDVIGSNITARAGTRLPEQINNPPNNHGVQPVIIKLVGPIIFSPELRKISLRSVRSKGGNLVADLQTPDVFIIITLRPDMVPVSATTNGVSIGAIPTNCVFYSDIVSNKVVTTVVY